MADVEAAVNECRAKLDHVINSTGTKEIDEAIRQTYTKEPRIFHPSGEVSRGHEEIKKNVSKNFFGFRLINTSDEVLYGGGDTVVSRGTWTFYKTSDGSVHSKGIDLMIFKKVDGQWYMHDSNYITETKSVKEALMSVMHAWSDALREGDFEKAASYMPDKHLPASGRKAVQDELMTVLNARSDTLQKGDFGKAASYFTPDGTYMLDKHSRASGRKEIKRAFKRNAKEYVATRGAVFHHDTECNEIGGGLATLRGSSVMRNRDGGVALRTRYLLTFKRLDDGKWYIHHDMSCEPAE